VQLNGDLFLHAWMLQRFQEKQSFNLVSQARQFSSFLVLVGKLTGPNTFEPEHGIILQNKDELLIPLLLEEMPSAKEFKDAISSLSPEQQRFAKAFRSMKLSSSVFGVCVIQLKPQLELLLNLPEKSLTKEIRLTQDLLSLFIDYQIPSDLLSYDGADDLEPSTKVEVVKGHVKKVLDMVNEMKNRDLEEEKQKADMRFEMGGAFGYAASMGSADCWEEASEDFSRRGGGKTMFGNAAPASLSLCGSSAPKPKPNRMSFGSAPAPPPPPQADLFVQAPAATSNQGHTNQDVTDSAQITNETQVTNPTDLTSIPRQLDSKFEMFGADDNYGGAIRSTTIKASHQWTKKHQKNLLTKLVAKSMSSDDQRVERNKAFDLLDALSRSGDVPMSHSELHIMIASTHCFDKSVVNTVVQDNVNPIEKIERSNLLVASQIHGVDVQTLLSSADDYGRITGFCPMLNTM